MYDVVSIGMAFSDVGADNIPHTLLHRHSVPLDDTVILSADAIGSLRRNLIAPRISGGGAAANSAASVAMLGKAGFIGVVGDDDLGRHFVNEMKQRNVDWIGDPIYKTGGVTAQCIVLTTEDRAKRSMAINFGCAAGFVREHFLDLPSLKTKFLFVEMELLEHSDVRQILMPALDAARSYMRLAFTLQNIGSRASKSANDSLVHGYIADAAHYINLNGDVIIGNAAEHTVFSNFAGRRSKMNQIRVVTRGEHGAEAHFGGYVESFPAVVPDQIIAGVGAGDGFAGAFLHALSNGAGIVNSLSSGSQFAAAVLSVPTARLPIGHPLGNLNR